MRYLLCGVWLGVWIFYYMVKMINCIIFNFFFMNILLYGIDGRGIFILVYKFVDF